MNALQYCYRIGAMTRNFKGLGHNICILLFLLFLNSQYNMIFKFVCTSHIIIIVVVVVGVGVVVDVVVF